MFIFFIYGKCEYIIFINAKHITLENMEYKS